MSHFEQITGDNVVVIETVSGGQLNINLTGPSPTLPALLQQAIAFLDVGSYRAAQEKCNQVFEMDRDQPQANVIMAIALMRGQGANRLRTGVVQKIETHLKKAMHHSSATAIAWVILGLVKFDHYVLSCLPEGHPTIAEIKSRLSTTNLTVSDRTLLDYVQFSNAAYQTLSIEEL